jgi:hypothetical protein
VISDGYDTYGVYENLDGAKVMCDIHNCIYIDEFELNQYQSEPNRSWIYTGSWRECSRC